MPGVLQVVGGPDQGRSFPLEEGQTLSIGRGQNTNTQLKDLQVSRVHCELQVEPGVFRLIDNGSAAGTLVNGRKVGEVELQHGDLIQIGTSQLRLLVAGVHDQSTLVATPGGPKPTARPTASLDLTGQTISHYEIGPVIAKGETGTIYKAKDNRDGHDVAFKVLGPEYSDSEEELQRFIRAMKTVVALKHENIVAVHGAGKNGPVCWIAMEYVDGESLSKVISRIGTVGMLDWRYALTVAVQIARALEAAHELHIIHRNITPQNILIRKKDNVAKLGDLMLAKALEGVMAKQVTRPGQMLGNISYMSPERTREDSSAVDTRSDIYSLGATIYALLTGRPPYEGTSLVDTVQKIRAADPVRPKKFQLSIPDLFEGAVMKMLAKRPDDRFQTPRELVHDLERVAKFNGMTIP